MTTAILKYSKFKPAKGGHAPSDLRDAFSEAVEAVERWEVGTPEPTVELREQKTRVSALFSLLWNCSDTLPSFLRDTIADLRPEKDTEAWTYAQAARALKRMVKHRLAIAA